MIATCDESMPMVDEREEVNASCSVLENVDSSTPDSVMLPDSTEVGLAVGAAVGLAVGLAVGVGAGVGAALGACVSPRLEGTAVGEGVGAGVG